jgi:hypothetical protein
MTETDDQMAERLDTLITLSMVLTAIDSDDNRAALRAGAHALRGHVCVWTPDPVDGGWDTACGGSWIFENYGPDENHITFCHGCGGRRVNAAMKWEE